MKHVKENPVGIDIEIQRIQNRIYPKLLEAWSLTDATYDCYGRAYRNQDREGNYNPEPYIGSQGIEYADGLYNDQVACTSFFGVDGERQHIGGNRYRANCFIIFELNLNKCKAQIQHRGDEEVHMDAISFLSKSLQRDTITSIVTEIDNIYREYSGWRSKTGMFNADNQPRHCFRINFELQYIYDKCYKITTPSGEVILSGFDYSNDSGLS